jgi:hypothetical protein
MISVGALGCQQLMCCRTMQVKIRVDDIMQKCLQAIDALTSAGGGTWGAGQGGQIAT